MTAGPLLSVEELAERLASPSPPSLLDVRWKLGGPPGVEGFRAGHIPGAAFVDLDRDLAGPPGQRGRHPLPDPEVFAAAMRRCGVRRDRAVAVYDADDSTSAARCWWLLRFHGHGEVHVLDGGLAAWVAAGRPLEDGEPAVAPGNFALAGGAGAMPVVEAGGVLALARRGVVLDARAAERYRGEVEPVDPVAGHIPGAVSAPTGGNVDPATGRFLDRERLAERFAALGVRPGVEVGSYCGSGVTAAHQVLALEVAGMTGTLYPGSWSEWVADPSRPVARGAEPG